MLMLDTRVSPATQECQCCLWVGGEGLGLSLLGLETDSEV